MVIHVRQFHSALFVEFVRPWRAQVTNLKWVCTQFLHKLDYPEDILRQLRKMTVTHRVEMLKHCRPYVKESVKTGKWRCHWEWNDAVAKIVQRMQDIGAFRGSDVPLNCCPCQLGTSDARDWEVIGDPCGQADVSLDSLVSTSCRCGRLSFKPYSATSTEMGYRIPEEHCKGVLLHMFKELLVQGLVGGQVQHMFNGRMARGEHDTADGLWRSFEMSGDAAARNKYCNLRNHICFLIAKKHLYHLKKDLAEQHGELNAERLLSVLPFEKIVERGEFHIAGTWLDDFKQKLLLQRGVICREEMVLWVGNYVGDSVYSIEGIIQTLKKPATPAFMSVLPYHIKELVQQPMFPFWILYALMTWPTHVPLPTPILSRMSSNLHCMPWLYDKSKTRMLSLFVRNRSSKFQQCCALKSKSANTISSLCLYMKTESNV